MAEPVIPAGGRRSVTLAAAALSLCLAVSTLGRGVLVRVADLYPVELPPQPYFVPGHALLLYVVMPLVVLASIAAQLGPGILLVAARGGSARTGDFVLRAFALAYALRVAAHGLLLAAGIPVGTGAAVAADAVLLLATYLLALRRAGGALPAWPVSDAAQRRRIAWMVLIAVAAVLLLLPAIFWQDLTEDGLEALQIGRSLAGHVVPRFPNDTGLMGLGVGMLAMAPPVHWFVTLMGPLEAAARLPLALYLPVLFGVLLELIEWRSPRVMSAGREAVLVLALGVFVVTMAYSASYTPYSADVAAPAAFETFTAICMGAVLLYLWQGQSSWMLAFVVLGYLARPTGLLVPLILVVATWLAVPERRRQWLPRLAIAIALCIAVMVVYEKVFVPMAAPGGAGYPSGSILRRLQYLRFDDWHRLLYAAVPGGILPFLSLAAWHKQDALARQLSLFCAAYFLFFYPQAFISLHHFVPVMILPLVVFWRLELSLAARPLLPMAAALAVLALWLSLPRHFTVDRTFRRIGRETDYRVGDFFGSERQLREAIRPRAALDSLFRRDWHIADPAAELVGTPAGLIFYADRAGPRDSVMNYVIQQGGAPPPEGFTRIASHRGLDLYVRDLERWRRERTSPPPTDFRSPVYAIPREVMHNFLGIPAKRYQINLADLPGMWRFFR